LTDTQYNVQPATAADRPAIRSLLVDARLPVADIDLAAELTFWIARNDSGPIGVIGLERYGNVGLLRSLVVARDQRRHGLGRRLVQALEQRAAETGIVELLLLTETAEQFFRRLGYAVIEGARAPAAVMRSEEFRTLCPATAACMSKRLLQIVFDDLSRPQVLALLEEHLRNMYELSPPDQVFAFDASKLKASDISFWTAWHGDMLLGCAALKELSPAEGEIKSMRTPVAARRKGAGRALLNHIIEVARSRAYRVLYLETGIHPAFLPAQTLYGSAGFKQCGPFGSYRENGNSVFMSLSLS